jgi:hypothetical protein
MTQNGLDYQGRHPEAAHAASEVEDPLEGAGAVVVPIVGVLVLLSVCGLLVYTLALMGVW